MKKKLIYPLLTFLLLFITSCNDEEFQAIDSENSGTLTGKVLSKNGLKPVGGAIVFTFDDKNEMYYTYSDANGDFSLKTPSGERIINIQTGGGTNFRTEVNVTIQKDETIALSETQTRLNQVARMAYIAGNYDNIESIVTTMGYNIELLNLSDLTNYSLLSQYDIIFLNCGSYLKNDNTAQSNLSKFVTNGGSLYASDWAIAFLMGGITSTSQCNATGGFIPDTTLCTTNTGSALTIPDAQITNTNLTNAIGFSALSIEYDLGGWQKIISCDANFWDVLVLNPTTQEPLMIKTNNFSNPTQLDTPVGNDASDQWVTICHIPPGNNSNPITITINQNALQAHLNHGDSLGSCTNTNNNGTIYFTSFHNHANANIGNSLLILEYVILNL